MSRCGHRYENLFYLASVFPLFLEQCCLCALAVMNWRNNLSPLIKTFRARYKHQNRCHITFYILHLSNISAGQYQLWWHLQVTGDTVDNDDHSTADWNITNLLCCLCRVSVFWISPLKLDAGACSSNFLDHVLVTECDAACGCSRGWRREMVVSWAIFLTPVKTLGMYKLDMSRYWNMDCWFQYKNRLVSKLTNSWSID